jgi:uncharacterized coiled-coil DUF342 family protein
MSKWDVNNHIVGKAYDLTQENMNAMIADIESLKKQINGMHEYINEYEKKCGETHKKLRILIIGLQEMAKTKAGELLTRIGE